MPPHKALAVGAIFIAERSAEERPFSVFGIVDAKALSTLLGVAANDAPTLNRNRELWNKFGIARKSM